MKSIKKLLAVVMAFAMLLSCFVVAASAYTYVPTYTSGEVKFITDADKTTVQPGDVVTFSLKIDPGSKTNLSAMNAVVVYSSAQLAPVGSTIAEFRTWQGDFAASFANPAAGGNMNLPMTQLSSLTAEEKGYFDKGIQIAGTGTSSASRWNPAAGEAFVTFQMTVSNSVKNGDEIWIGMHHAAFTRGVASLAINGVRQQNTAFDLTDSMLKLTVGSAAAPELSVKYMRDQIRFQKNGAEYAGAFDYRILAEIENFDEIFADIDAAKASIKDVGFVFNKGAAIDLDTAKAQVEGGAKTYSQVSNIYVSTNFETGKYVIACFVENIPDADKTTALSALAYVIYEQDGVTKYAYFDAAQTSPFTTLYNQYYSQAFPA